MKASATTVADGGRKIGQGGAWERRRETKKGRVDVAWGSFSRSRLPSPGTRSARIFLLASTEDQTSHFISADPFKLPSSCFCCSTPFPPPEPTSVLPLLKQRALSCRNPRCATLFYPNSRSLCPSYSPTSARAMVDHV